MSKEFTPVLDNLIKKKAPREELLAAIKDLELLTQKLLNEKLADALKEVTNGGPTLDETLMRLLDLSVQGSLSFESVRYVMESSTGQTDGVRYEIIVATVDPEEFAEV